MDDSNQHKAIEGLRDWSKWLIGFNFAAASGCVVVLLGGAAGLPRMFLIAAILSFALSVISSVLLVRILVNVVESLPIRDETGKLISIHSYKMPAGFSLGMLSWVQFFFLIVAIIFFITWVLIRPVPG